MKKIILLPILILFQYYGNGQGLPVYDNTNFISLAKSLIESAKQTSELLKTVEFLREQKDNIMQVSEVVRQLRAVTDMVQNQQRLYQLVETDLREILNSPYIRPHEVTRISVSFNAILERSMEDLNFMEQLLSSNHLKMSDTERTTLLLEKEQASWERVTELEQKTRRYREIIAFRSMQESVNNRPAHH